LIKERIIGISDSVADLIWNPGVSVAITVTSCF
jgi:hypothetical protein